MPPLFRAILSLDKGMHPPAHSKKSLLSSALYRIRIGLQPSTDARVTSLDGPSPVAIIDAGTKVRRRANSTPITRAIT